MALLACRAGYVQMIDIAATSLGKKGHHVVAIYRLQQAVERVWVVGAVLQPSDRVKVVGEVDIRGKRRASVGFNIHHSYRRVDGTSGSNDLGIALARIPSHGPIGHMEATIEAD